VRLQARRVARRSGPWLLAALVLALLSIPAAFDLNGLFVGLAVICGGLGVVTAAYTWFDKQPD
jgi:hypothetical protein